MTLMVTIQTLYGFFSCLDDKECFNNGIVKLNSNCYLAFNLETGIELTVNCFVVYLIH